MNIYLVGGAVRDQYLGLPIHERDWVVVGASPENMLKDGYQPVGKDFPVFLHPDTKEEYALARTERKSGRGYAGFTFNTSASVTLTEDLLRRDLTINAMALDQDGKLVDPYNGLTDLNNRILRHVSLAFAEDPVRVLRTARFAARFAHLEFKVAAETIALMQTMTDNGEIDYLVPERVWQEFAKSLATNMPSVFFEILTQCGALPVIFPEAIGIDVSLVNANTSALIRFALLGTRFNGDGKTRRQHVQHCVKSIAQLGQRLRIPNAWMDLAKLVSRWHYLIPKMTQLPVGAQLDFLMKCDVLRRRERFDDFLQACKLIYVNQDLSVSIAWCQQAIDAIKSVDTKPLVEQSLKGIQFAHALRKMRIQALAKLK